MIVESFFEFLNLLSTSITDYFEWLIEALAMSLSILGLG